MNHSQQAQQGLHPPGSFKARLVEMVPPWIRPNHITCFRLFCALSIAVLGLAGVGLGWLLLIGFVAGMSDLLDGLVARQRGQVSKLGAFLDPLGDKVLAVCCAIVILDRGYVGWWTMLAILAVEAHAVVVPLLHIIRQRRRGLPIWPGPKIKPNLAGKVKTFGLISGIGVIVLGGTFGWSGCIVVGRWLVWIAIALGVVASAMYYRGWWQGNYDET